MESDKNTQQGRGRPTDYSPTHCDEIPLYMAQCVKDKHIPTYAGLANHLDTTKKTIHNWAAKHPDFLHSLSKMLQKQQQMLINKGLNKEYSHVIAKLMLSANHGMSEKTIQSHEVSAETATLLGMIDGSSKGQLPTGQEAENAG